MADNLPGDVSVVSAKEFAAQASIQRRIGTYRIMQELGRGGMGIVYKALDEEHDRLVAIKVLPPDFLTDKRKANYLHHEFQIALELKHPNVITFYKLIERANPETKLKEGYLVMELVDGWSMRQHIDQQDLSLFEAIELCLEICKGLGFIHQRGIIHGDFKPENILIAKDVVKVADFGLSAVQTSWRLFSGRRNQRLRGTPEYMAPEQLRRKAVDQRTDIYAFGVSLYKLATGKSPYKAKNQVELQREIYNMRSQFIPPSEVKKNLPPQLDQIVLRALQKHPEKRYQTVAEMVLDFNRLRRMRRL